MPSLTNRSISLSSNIGFSSPLGPAVGTLSSHASSFVGAPDSSCWMSCGSRPAVPAGASSSMPSWWKEAMV